MEPESNSNQAIVFATIAGVCGAVIAGAFTAGQPDITGVEVVRNAALGGGLAPILLYAVALVVEFLGSRD